MTKNNLKSTCDSGFVVQIGETLQTVIVGVLDGSSTIFRAVIGTFKDSTIFAIKSTKEVSDEVNSAITDSVKKTIEETKNISSESTKLTFGFLFDVGKNLKTTTLESIDGAHEVSTKAANTFGKTLVDLSQCVYDTGAKIGSIAKTGALNAIKGSSEVAEELFGKIKSGVGGVIKMEAFKSSKKKIVNAPPDNIENN